MMQCLITQLFGIDWIPEIAVDTSSCHHTELDLCTVDFVKGEANISPCPCTAGRWPCSNADTVRSSPGSSSRPVGKCIRRLIVADSDHWLNTVLVQLVKDPVIECKAGFIGSLFGTIGKNTCPRNGHPGKPSAPFAQRAQYLLCSGGRNLLLCGMYRFDPGWMPSVTSRPWEPSACTSTTLTPLPSSFQPPST